MTVMSSTGRRLRESSWANRYIMFVEELTKALKAKDYDHAAYLINSDSESHEVIVNPEDFK